MCIPGAFRSQEEALDALELELEMVCKQTCGCWGLNLGLLEEQPVLLTRVTSQPPLAVLKSAVAPLSPLSLPPSPLPLLPLPHPFPWFGTRDRTEGQIHARQGPPLC
jgi:hypothetical protein